MGDPLRGRALLSFAEPGLCPGPAGNDPLSRVGYPGRLRPPDAEGPATPGLGRVGYRMQPPAARRFAFRVLACGQQRALPRGFFQGGAFPRFSLFTVAYSSRSLPWACALRARAFITLRVTKLPLHSRAHAHGRHLPGDDEERKTVKEKGFPP